MSDAPPPNSPPRGTPAQRRGAAARRRRSAHGDGARHRAGPAASRRAGKDAHSPGLCRVRFRSVVPRGDRQARRSRPSCSRSRRTGRRGRSRRCLPRRSRRRPTVARAARHDHRPQRPDPGDLAAHSRGVRRSAADHRSRRRGPPVEEGACRASTRRWRARVCPIPTGSSSTSSARSRRASNWRSIRSAYRASISARPSNGTTRWAVPPPRCWAAPMSTNTASPASRSTSISACSATARRSGCRSMCACRRWCVTNCPRRWTTFRRSAAAAS